MKRISKRGYYTGSLMVHNRTDGFDAGRAAVHRRYVESLSSNERMLITIRDELYEGNWDLMLSDLQQRLEGKMYIFRLVNKIEQDIEGIKKLQLYEKDHNINLNNFI